MPPPVESPNAPNRPLSEALYEPVQGVFLTQHSTHENREIARKGLILLTEIGSTMHGVSDPSTGDDVDEMGICIEPPTHVIGLGQFEQYEYRTQPVNVRSGPGDIDRIVYSLRKFATLLASGNPTVLMPLFVPAETYCDPAQKHKEMVRYINWAGVDLRRHRDLFLSKQCGERFLGYLDGQRQRYLDTNRTDSKHTARPELVEKYGWDTKTGYHALRLAIQGTQLMNDHYIELPMNNANRAFLLNVRSGVYSKEAVTQLLDETYIPTLKTATENSTLPEKPDYQKINDWLSEVYQDFWFEHEDYVSKMKGRA